MQFLTPTTLTGHLVSLEPLDDVHIEGLRAAVQDGHINDLWYTSAPAPETVAADVKAKRDLAERGLMRLFTMQGVVRVWSGAAGRCGVRVEVFR